MGPLKVAHLNGLSVSRPPLHNDFKDEPETASNDERVSRFGVYNFFLVKQMECWIKKKLKLSVRGI